MDRAYPNSSRDRWQSLAESDSNAQARTEAVSQTELTAIAAGLSSIGEEDEIVEHSFDSIVNAGQAQVSCAVYLYLLYLALSQHLQHFLPAAGAVALSIFSLPFASPTLYLNTSKNPHNTSSPSRCTWCLSFN